MWKDWIWPMLAMTMKFGFAVAVLAGVWVGSALYHEAFYKEQADSVIKIRVTEECLRPEWVKTEMDAKKYDLTAQELDLVRDKLKFVDRRMEKLMDEAERIETMRREFASGKVKAPLAGIGGPAPNPKRKE